MDGEEDSTSRSPCFLAPLGMSANALSEALNVPAARILARWLSLRNGEPREQIAAYIVTYMLLYMPKTAWNTA